jgi:hypothetical protein
MHGSFTTMPWGWHGRYVGVWNYEIPLHKEKLRCYGDNCLLDVLGDLMAIMRDLFVVTRVECPYKCTIVERPMPMSPSTVRMELAKRWENMRLKDHTFSPEAYLFGLSYVYARNTKGPIRTLVPGVLSFRMECDLDPEDPRTWLSVYTTSDAWLETTIEGVDNQAMGSLNEQILKDMLMTLESRLYAKVIDYGTGYVENIEVNKYGIKRK